MCNLYALTTAQEAMRQVFGVHPEHDHLGNAEPMRAIYPRYDGAVVRKGADGLELRRMHWGFVLPQVSKRTGQPIQPKAVNNARDEKIRSSRFWTDSFETRRCLVPASAFAEATGRNPATYHWFGTTAPVFAFAGIWKHHRGKYKDDLVEIDTYSIVTCAPNAWYGRYHNRMPVVLREEDYVQLLEGSVEDAAELIAPTDDLVLIDEGIGMKEEPERDGAT